MEAAWDHEDYLNYHYSRAAVREVCRRRGIRKPKEIGGLEKQAAKIAGQMMYQPPEIELGPSLMPVVIHDLRDGQW